MKMNGTMGMLRIAIGLAAMAATTTAGAQRYDEDLRQTMLNCSASDTVLAGLSKGYDRDDYIRQAVSFYDGAKFLVGGEVDLRGEIPPRIKRFKLMGRSETAALLATCLVYMRVGQNYLQQKAK